MQTEDMIGKAQPCMLKPLNYYGGSQFCDKGGKRKAIPNCEWAAMTHRLQSMKAMEQQNKQNSIIFPSPVNTVKSYVTFMASIQKYCPRATTLNKLQKVFLHIGSKNTGVWTSTWRRHSISTNSFFQPSKQQPSLDHWTQSKVGSDFQEHCLHQQLSLFCFSVETLSQQLY